MCVKERFPGFYIHNPIVTLLYIYITKSQNQTVEYCPAIVGGIKRLLINGMFFTRLLFSPSFQLMWKIVDDGVR